MARAASRGEKVAESMGAAAAYNDIDLAWLMRLRTVVARLARWISPAPSAGHHDVSTTSASTTGTPRDANEQRCPASRSPTHRKL
jgi:hypothetical protein